MKIPVIVTPLVFLAVFMDIHAQQVWFEQDFAKQPLGDSWKLVNGLWDIRGGVLSISTHEYDQLLVSRTYVYDTSPYSVEVRMRGNRAGLFFAVDDTTSKLFSHMVRFDDKSILTGYFNGAGEYVATNMFDIPRAPSEWTLLRVDVDPGSGRYEVFVDGTSVGVDDRLVFSSGYIGMEGSEGISEFTSVRVTGERNPTPPPRPARHSAVRFQHVTFVRSGKGDKDRSTVLPKAVKERLREHLKEVKALHEKDLAAGYGNVFLPDALSRKYPNTAKAWAWQYVFPSSKLSVDPRSGKIGRHHISDTAIQTAVKTSVFKAGIPKHASVHTLRYYPGFRIMPSYI